MFLLEIDTKPYGHTVMSYVKVVQYYNVQNLWNMNIDDKECYGPISL